MNANRGRPRRQPARLHFPFPGNRAVETTSGDPLSGRYLVWVSPTNTVKFLGKPFDAVDDTSTAALLIDAESLDQVVKQRKVLPGMRLSTKCKKSPRPGVRYP